MSGNYNRQGERITYDEWAKLATDNYKRVAYDKVRHYRVSTVWLGMDHNFSVSGPPIIFETMVFKGKNWTDLFNTRYATEEAALIGHAWVVSELKRGVRPENLVMDSPWERRMGNESLNKK